MNIVNAGNRYQIYGEELHTFNKLPVGSYEVYLLLIWKRKAPRQLNDNTT